MWACCASSSSCCGGANTGGDSEPVALLPKVLDPPKEVLAEEEREIQALQLFSSQEREAAADAEPGRKVEVAVEETVPSDLGEQVEELGEAKAADGLERGPHGTLAAKPDQRRRKWVYRPVNGKALQLRTSPGMFAEPTGEVLQPGEAFEVEEEKAGEQGVVFLRLAERRGWAFDQKPRVGVMCVPQEAEKDSGQKRTKWVHRPVNNKPMKLRTSPSLTAQESGKQLEPQEVFEVEEEKEGIDRVLFLRLADGRGWAFDQIPGLVVMCHRQEDRATQQQEEPQSDPLKQQDQQTTPARKGEKGAASKSCGPKCCIQ